MQKKEETDYSCGIYIHIPFCRQACRYCDFYFTVSLQYVNEFIQAVGKEYISREKELSGKPVSSIYFGGGTPSILNIKQLAELLVTLRKIYHPESNAEITIEVNPDDMDPVYASELFNIGFNRISIGVQSFDNEDLNLMRRSHDSMQAVTAVQNAFKAGFRNISIDLIYGIPGGTNQKWEKNLQMAFNMPIGHLSAYHLTYEPDTVFGHWIKQGRIRPVPEEESLRHYQLLREIAQDHQFLHYEISNFGKNGYFSRHNMIYWKRKNYIGVGPSAHSFNGRERRWNISSLKRYLAAIDTGEIYYETEKLGTREHYHDYLITALRTREGINKSDLESVFGREIIDHFRNRTMKFIENGQLVDEKEYVRMTPESWFISDYVIEGLFLE
ncbi:MAG: radical SAM family heme chaperone HemW [Bacteroidales bacterium]|nr:radical SAM family heme chaperone HemW [Bacteroidales bacterium]MBN2699073.1 radical SAM family heme chaperone HemW [Bacteroidales bacterium]